MIANSQPSLEKIVDVKRIAREEKFITKINFYAAFGIATLSTATLIGLVLLLTLTAESIPYAFQQIVNASSLVAATAIFIFLPMLVVGKYGWRTVVMAVLLQSLLSFFTVLLLSLFAPNDIQSPQPVPYYDEGVELQKDF